MKFKISIILTVVLLSHMITQVVDAWSYGFYLETDPVVYDSALPPKSIKTVALKNVSFKLGETNLPIINDLKIQIGESITVVEEDSIPSLWRPLTQTQITNNDFDWPGYQKTWWWPRTGSGADNTNYPGTNWGNEVYVMLTAPKDSGKNLTLSERPIVLTNGAYTKVSPTGVGPVVECIGYTCVAKRTGPFQIWVYPYPGNSIVQSSSYPIKGDPKGYGKFDVFVAQYGRLIEKYTKTYKIGKVGELSEDITVLQGEVIGPSNPQQTSCSGITNISENSATINWTYSDPDNSSGEKGKVKDPQTNYQIQIATDSAFNSIVKSVAAPANTDVSAVRSATIDGLTSDTTYYSRVRSYNNSDTWSEYSSCSLFKTKVSDCDQTICTQGVEYLKTCNQDGTFNTVATGNTCNNDGTYSCTSPATTYKGQTTYTVSPTATSYEWFSNGTKISGETGRSYSKTYDTTGTKTDVTVKIIQNNATQTLSCRGQINCDTSHREGEKTACVGGFQSQYYCSETGWKTNQIVCDPLDPTDPTDPTGTGGDPVVTTFKFEPAIVNPNADGEKKYCGLTLQASNVSMCELISAGTNQAPDLKLPTVEGILLYSKNRFVPTGRYTLKCTGTGENPVTKTYGPQSCVGNPQFQED